MRINPNLTWKTVQDRFDKETNPVFKRNLGLVLAHMKAEARGDIDGVIATLVDKPRYRVYGAGATNNPALNPEGSHDVVRAFYDLILVQTGAHALEFDVDRVIVDETTVITEGRMRMAYPGKTLIEQGIDIDDPDALYLTDFRQIYIWPVDPAVGKLIGEEIYSSGDQFEGIADRKIAGSDIAPLEHAA